MFRVRFSKASSIFSLNADIGFLLTDIINSTIHNALQIFKSASSIL